MMRLKSLPYRDCMTRSLSMKPYPTALASRTPTVLLPEAGIPIKLIFSMNYSPKTRLMDSTISASAGAHSSAFNSAGGIQR